MKDWTGKSILVIGAARQGLALARYLSRHGAGVILNDIRPEKELTQEIKSLAQEAMDWPGSITWKCGSHPIELLDDVELVLISGGIPLSLPLINEARNRGIRLSNDSQIFLELAPCKVIGITGSAGKTTTTTIVGRIATLSHQYHKVWVGGNIGSPLISFLDLMQEDDLAVMELSSFQLEIMDQAPQVSAILNITPNHLDRHESMETYTAAKARILDNQSLQDIAILGRDDPVTCLLKNRVKGRMFTFGLSKLPPGEAGAYLSGDKILIRQVNNQELKILDRSDILLRGEHNLLNVMAACTITVATGIESQVIPPAIQGFTGVPHRLEHIRNWKGAQWFNDSIATAPERALAAMRSFDEPLVLLAGGRDKNLPWAEFARFVCLRVDHLVLFGEASEKIYQAVMQAKEEILLNQATPSLSDGGENLSKTGSIKLSTINRCQKLHEAVLKASDLAQPGDVVLLSPGGTSFDEFRDFEERGKCFAQWVMQLP